MVAERVEGVSAFGFNFLQEVLMVERDGNCRRAGRQGTGRGLKQHRVGNSTTFQPGQGHCQRAWPGGKYRMRIHGI